ncbi:hypothetical protein [Pyxidicoccus trucidator]|uniref:hypothetical protein n=1 Tax=Pyxidicoccus trucidator TaxID=2709662 RepID=UPI0013DACBEE|nr:hypothetical protein [Pyxidicoccus trucidator]
MAETPSEDRMQADFGMSEASDALRLWNALVLSMAGFWQQQGLAMGQLFDQGRKGQLGVSQLVSFSFATWLRGMSLWLTPGRLASAQGQVPSLIFIIDRDSESPPPQKVMLTAAVDESELELTPIMKFGGPAERMPGGEPAAVLSARGIECHVTDGGTQLEVRLVGLSGQTLDPGFYAGIVYSKRRGEAHRWPRAFIWIFAALSGAGGG